MHWSLNMNMKKKTAWDIKSKDLTILFLIILILGKIFKEFPVTKANNSNG